MTGDPRTLQILDLKARAAEHDEMPYIPSRDDKHMDVRHWWSFRSAGAIHDHYDEKLPKEIAKITQAPEVPPPVNRSHPVHLIVDLASEVKTLPLSQTQKYEFWCDFKYPMESSSMYFVPPKNCFVPRRCCNKKIVSSIYSDDACTSLRVYDYYV